jgi:renalase
LISRIAGWWTLTQQIAVIGAGLAGLACAQAMRRAGCYVEVFEQDRVIGGRIATLRQGSISFDHGAQYVTARGSAFGGYLDEMTGTGYATRWLPRTNESGVNGVQMLPWIVGTPGMASLVRPLAEGLRIHTSRRAHTITRNDTKSGQSWHIWFDDQTTAGPFNAVAIAVPAPQARLLLGKLDDVAAPLARVRMMPCWAMMAHFDTPVLPNQDVFSDMSEVIRWIARNNHKPSRGKVGESIVVHASPGYSREAEDVDPQVIAAEIWDEVSRVLALPDVQPAFKTAFLWRYGLVDQSLGESFVFSSKHMVGVAGDWCLGRLAEHAYDSGVGLGKAIANSF